MNHDVVLAAAILAGWVALMTAVLPMSGPATGLQTWIARKFHKKPGDALDISNLLTGGWRFIVVVAPAAAAFVLSILDLTHHAPKG